jgi:hypothetical protein
MRSALIDNQTNIVDNIIIADPSVDPTPEGYIMIVIPDGMPVVAGWMYDFQTNTFIDPNPPENLLENEEVL